MRTTGHRGVFVTIDGPGGAGKSTVTADLCRHLNEQGYATHPTAEPSHASLGVIARHQTHRYRGYPLACLVAADRYDHLDAEIRPNLARGSIVICDRYVASSYVLQRMDGVPIEFIQSINAAADVPDLAVILTAKPKVAAARIRQRGAHSRFEAGTDTSRAESDLYNDTTARLAERGYRLLTIDTTNTSVEKITAVIAERIAHLAGLPQPRSTGA